MRYIPEKKNIITNLDDLGLLLDMPRIEGENLASYRDRLMSGSNKQSSSTYDGLINAINRELGLKREEVIEVDIKKMELFKLGNGDSLVERVLTSGSELSGEIGIDAEIEEGGLVLKKKTLADGELRGKTIIFSNGFSSDIKENTATKLFFSGQVQTHSGLGFVIQSKWKRNKYVGYSLYSSIDRKNILRNTENQLELDGKLLYKQDDVLFVAVDSPRIEVNSAEVILYKNYVNEENFQLDIQIDLQEKGKHYRNIIDEINQSQFFVAKDLCPMGEQRQAFTLKKTDSDIDVFNELVPPSKFFKLKNKNIKDSSLSFSETGVFLRETTELEQIKNGPYYYCNYKDGVIKTKTLPSGNGSVSYKYSNFPLKIESTPGVLYSFSNEDTRSFLFTKKEKARYTDPRKRYMSSQPKTDMIEYISELLSISKQYWGK